MSRQRTRMTVVEVAAAGQWPWSTWTDGRDESRRPNDKTLRPQRPRPRTSDRNGRAAQRAAVAAQGCTAAVSAAARARLMTSPPRDGRTVGAGAVAVSAATRPRT